MDELEKVERSTYRYWYTDGLAEISTGCVFGLLGIFFLAQGLAPGGPLAMLSAVILPLIMIVGSLLARRLVNEGKNRLTYPRTGYVSYHRQPRRSRWQTAVVAIFVAALAVIVVQRISLSLSWVLLAEGAIIGAGLAYPGYRFGLQRFYALAILSVVAAAGAAQNTQDANLGNAIYFGAVAVGLLISGVLTLIGYLRSNRLPEERNDV